MINVALVSRESYRTIADRTGLSKTSLIRHSSEHLPELLVQATRAIEVDDANRLLSLVEELREEAMQVLEEAKGERNGKLRLSAIATASKQLELLGKLLGQIDERPQVNVLLVSPRVQQVIVNALDPYPEAKVAVAGALEVLDLEEAPG